MYLSLKGNVVQNQFIVERQDDSNPRFELICHRNYYSRGFLSRLSNALRRDKLEIFHAIVGIQFPGDPGTPGASARKMCAYDNRDDSTAKIASVMFA